jgi:hypothetical protein
MEMLRKKTPGKRGMMPGKPLAGSQLGKGGDAIYHFYDGDDLCALLFLKDHKWTLYTVWHAYPRTFPSRQAAENTMANYWKERDESRNKK